ncbi:hypothetical protein FQA39_LY13465 [Lamprigera yunnana]|nr:hypothetical protein FQA39_LY13465 [Lamprigera yunnana]
MIIANVLFKFDKFYEVLQWIAYKQLSEIIEASDNSGYTFSEDKESDAEDYVQVEERIFDKVEVKGNLEGAEGPDISGVVYYNSKSDLNRNLLFPKLQDV